MTKITDTNNLRLGATKVDKVMVNSVAVYPAPYAFPKNGILSDFAGAAVTPPPGFTNKIVSTESNMQTSGSGQAQLNSGSNPTCWWNARTFGPDCEAYVQCAVKPGNGNAVRLYLRTVSPGTATPHGYIVKARQYAATDEFEICRTDNGVDTILGATIPLEYNVNDWIGASIIGNVITAYIKPAAGVWTVVGSRIDTTYPVAGYIGMGCSFSTFRLDNFGGGNI